jgi:hypothetical protein
MEDGLGQNAKQGPEGGPEQNEGHSQNVIDGIERNDGGKMQQSHDAKALFLKDIVQGFKNGIFLANLLSPFF